MTGMTIDEAVDAVREAYPLRSVSRDGWAAEDGSVVIVLSPTRSQIAGAPNMARVSDGDVQLGTYPAFAKEIAGLRAFGSTNG